MNPSILYFLHIHKSGGSTFINLATKNNMRFYKPNANGNPLYHHYDSGDVIRFWWWEKKKQLKFLKDHRYNFIVNEDHIKDHIYDPMIAYVTIIRNPLDIILSDYHHAKIDAHFEFYEYIYADKEIPWYRNSPLIYSLSGSGDYQKALENLKKFNGVIFLDSYKNDMMVMKDIMNWRYINPDKFREGTCRNSNAEKELSNDKLTALKNVLKKDIEFYNETRSVFKNGKLINKL